MITTRSSVRTEVIYSDDMNHRLILKKDWSRDKEKLKCTIIMINPSTADEIEMDRTTMNIINNLKRLNYHTTDRRKKKVTFPARILYNEIYAKKKTNGGTSA